MNILEEFYHYFKLDIRWAVCGGFGIDLFIGKKTRNHKDLDIAVFWKDREQIIQFMLNNNWRVFEPDQGRLREITSLKNDYRTKYNLWCLSRDNKSYRIRHLEGNFYDINTMNKNQSKLDFIEFLFSECEGEQVLYRRNHNISRKVKKVIQFNNRDIPYLAPELILLYKANVIPNKNNLYNDQTIIDYRHDFSVSVDQLSTEQVNWLYKALKLTYPEGHEWIRELENKL